VQHVTLDEAVIHLSDLIEAAVRGEDVCIKKDELYSVQLVPRQSKKRIRQFGSAKGLIVMAEDFDDALPDFKEYME
jgi:antitoxin (DNA-binding transcriptional repressor) of toxin-antitoxin stability system